jgi:hypothetical protein
MYSSRTSGVEAKHNQNQKDSLPPRKAEGTKVAGVEVTIVDDRRKGRYQLLRVLGGKGSRQPQK